MLYEFLEKYKTEIIQLCKSRVATDSEMKPTSALLEAGLPLFYNELIGVLYRTATSSGSQGADIENKIKEGDAATHGKESLRLGYTLSQVVHSYGAVCQSITEYVQTKAYAITVQEFQDLNLSLDCAIAEAVTEFEKAQSTAVSHNEIERLGFLMHEMRNSLSSASAAYQMIQKGSVGVSGVTSEVLNRSHARMQRLIERAEAEIRLRGHDRLERNRIRLIDVVNEVYSAASVTERFKEIHLKLDIDDNIQVITDSHLLVSALSNLVNNAMKFTRKDGNVLVRGKQSGGRILIEVEDECGGLPEEDMEKLFKPFFQESSDKTGMGLGLSLSRKAVESNQGRLTARNIPKKGCVFTIDFPKDEKTPPLTSPSRVL